MKTVLAVLALIVGLGFIGQLISVINFKLAQKLGLQEKDEETDPLFSRLELNTAKWDLVVMWTLPIAAVLMLIDHGWWPYVGILAGGINIDTGGREIAKILGLRAKDVKTGTPAEVRLLFGYLTLLTVTGLALVIYAFMNLKMGISSN
jgi:hypothetical protein